MEAQNLGKTYLIGDRFLKIDLSRLDNIGNLKDSNVLSERLKHVITRLLSIHFTGKLHLVDSNHIELSLPDPELLQIDGPKELYSKHLYVNLSKYLNGENAVIARCVKTDRKYDINTLLSMPSINNRFKGSDRRFKYTDSRVDLDWDPNPFLEKFKDKDALDLSAITFASDNSQDVEVKSPGVTIPLTQLSQNHPAVEYLRRRGFSDLQQLENQFKACYCIKESNRFTYGRLLTSKSKLQDVDEDNIPQDMIGSLPPFDPLKCVSPQGRIIFYATQLGIDRLWQGRIIDETANGYKYIYAHYGEDDPRNGFKPVAKYDEATHKFVPLEDSSVDFKKIIRQKYILSPGSKASSCLLGYDAAVAFNKNRPIGTKVIGLCEGALDAARMGPPFCSFMGGTLSTGQLKLISNGYFDRVLIASDHDTVGNDTIRKLRNKISLLGDIKIDELDYPLAYKDLGEIMDQNVILDLKRRYELY